MASLSNNKFLSYFTISFSGRDMYGFTEPMLERKTV